LIRKSQDLPRKPSCAHLAVRNCLVEVETKMPAAGVALSPAVRPRVLDLFGGCGGLSLGFQAAGCDIVAAMESDELAARSHAVNFCKGRSVQEFEHHALARDITKIGPEDLIEDFSLGATSHAIDIIIGGPPCWGGGAILRRPGATKLVRPRSAAR
jgi:hypothetical protein